MNNHLLNFASLDKCPSKSSQCVTCSNRLTDNSTCVPQPPILESLEGSDKKQRFSGDRIVLPSSPKDEDGQAAHMKVWEEEVQEENAEAVNTPSFCEPLVRDHCYPCLCVTACVQMSSDQLTLTDSSGY